jgi:uncharacterized protein YegP (UPF0339 family)
MPIKKSKKKLPRPFILKDSDDGQFFSTIVYPRGNREVAYTTETYTQKQKAKQAIHQIAINIYEALYLIDFDMSRLDELIDDQTEDKRQRPPVTPEPQP